MDETPHNRPENDRNRFVPVSGHRPGHFGLGVNLIVGADLGRKSAISSRILKNVRGLF